MKINLPETISSPQDLRALTLEVHEYARWFAHAAVKQRLAEGKVAEAEAPTLSPAAGAIIKDWHAKVEVSVDSLDKLIASLEETAEKAEVINITLAAPPVAGLKKSLTLWCRQNLNPNVLVTFDFNATLLGGMVVRSGSRIFDWSFRRQILDNRSKFPEVLRHVR